MDLVKVVKERRSIRRYSDQYLEDRVIEKIAEISRFAPSWKNSQVTRYNIVPEKIKKIIGEECVLDFIPNKTIIERCSRLAVVSVLKNISGFEKDGSYTTDFNDSWEMFDAGIAVQTFCLAAHDMGVGTVILGIFDPFRIHSLTNLSASERVVALVAMGYPEGPARPGPARLEASEIIRFQQD